MGTIFPDTVVECNRCGGRVKVEEKSVPEEVVCVVCRSLGDRAIVPLLANPTPEAIERFRAAPKGSVLFEAGLRRRGVKR